MIKPYFCDDNNWNVFRNELESWKGTPYRHFQKAKGYGADCTMFLGACFVNVGVLSDLSYEYYSKDWHLNSNTEIVERWIYENICNNVTDKSLKFKKLLIVKDDFIRGDFLLISTSPTGVANHCAVIVDKNNSKMIHSINNRGVCEAHYNSWWKRHTKYKMRLFKEF